VSFEGQSSSASYKDPLPSSEVVGCGRTRVTHQVKQVIQLSYSLSLFASDTSYPDTRALNILSDRCPVLQASLVRFGNEYMSTSAIHMSKSSSWPVSCICLALDSGHASTYGEIDLGSEIRSSSHEALKKGDHLNCNH
jgi:hypothetical protein